MRIYNPSKYSYITIVEIPKDEISKIDMDICAQPRQTLKKYYDQCAVKPAILCNGGFFSMETGDPTFTYKDDNVEWSKDFFYREGMGISNGSLTFGNVDKFPFEDFVSAYPVLIRNGQKVKINTADEINYKARRTVLAYNGLYVYVIAIESPGMNFTQMQNFLLELNVDYAINLDGGGSTKILHDGKSITSVLNNRAVDNVIAFYLLPKKVYRVQVGAFKLKSNATNLLAKVRKEVGCQEAYVKCVNGIYKVQIGAFTNKQNAVNLSNQLKAKGYNVIITS